MIYFVRHGQTDDNFNHIVQGNKHLNDTGIKQAQETALILKNQDFDICFCSPFNRTKETLNEILKYHPNLKVIYDNRLIERQYYELIGLAKKDVPLYEKRWDNNIVFPCDAETIDQVYNRVENFYNEIKEEYKDKKILIVSHSGVARVSRAYFEGKPNDNDYSKYKIKNAEVITFEFKKGE